MGNLRVVLSALVLLPVLACGGDNATPDAAKPSIDAPKTVDAPKAIDAPPPPDAQAFDFSCLGSANPTTTTAVTVTVSGTADGLVGTSISPVSGVPVTLVKDGSDDLQTVTTDGSGDFMFTPVATNGSAVDLSLKATGSGSGARDNLVFPAAPLVADQPNVPVLAINDSALSELSLVAGVSATPADGVFLFQVSDCAGTAIGGATITIDEGGSGVGQVVDVGSLLAQLTGTYLGVNVPPGTVTVTTVVEGHTFRTRTLPSVTETNTTTQIKP